MKRPYALMPAKRRMISLFLCFAVIFAALYCYMIVSYSESSNEPPGRVNLVRTSFNEESYSLFEAQGSKIQARGRYANDRIRKLYIHNYEDVSGTYSMRVGDGGTYEAELNVVPDEGEQRLVVQLTSGVKLSYVIFYSPNRGWYFPDNGLSEKNRRVFDHIYEAPDEAAALYLSASEDAGEVQFALSKIRELTESITAGIDDDYQKARAISAYIAEHLYYDHDARNTDVDLDTIALYNVLHSYKTVCAGFANLFCAMCEAAGIDAVNIKGGVTTDEITYAMLTDGKQNHEFAAFFYEKQDRWVWADACWDGSSDYEDGEYKKGLTKEMYFDVCDSVLSFNHRADKAERRHYFSAKVETAIETTAEPEGPSQGLITSGEKAETTQIAEESAGTLPYAPEPPNGKSPDKAPETPSAPSGQDDTIFIVIIAVLGAAVAAAAVILIITIIKGRKNSKW